MNLSLPTHILKLLPNPSLCLPHHTIPTFAHLPALLSNPQFPPGQIRAIVLDKDNCIAAAGSNTLFPAYSKTIQLLAAQPASTPRLLIVSNSAGSSSDAPAYKQATALEAATGIAVLRHGGKKPGCGAAVVAALRRAGPGAVDRPSQILVVGDRLGTDVLLANTMGARAVWVTDGVVRDEGVWSRAERGLFSFLTRRGYVAPEPRSAFE